VTENAGCHHVVEGKIAGILIKKMDFLIFLGFETTALTRVIITVIDSLPDFRGQHSPAFSRRYLGLLRRTGTARRSGNPQNEW